MKKLFILLFLIALFSCEKDSYCWECTTTIRTTCSDPNAGHASGAVTTDVVTVKTTECDMSTKEIDAVERSLTSTTTATSGGIICTVKSTCHCNQITE